MEIKDQIIDNLPYLQRGNLELLLGSNRRNLDNRVAVLLKNKKLYRVKRGFYISVKFYENEPNKEDFLIYIAELTVSNSYVSLETALNYYGIIPDQAISTITLVTTKKTNIVNFELTSFSYKNIKVDLYTGFIEKKYNDKTIFYATKSKALFDFIYLKSLGRKSTEISNFLLTDSRINWSNLTEMDIREFYSYVELSKSKKMKNIFNILKKKGIL